MMENNQTPERPRPDEEFVIANLETLKVVAEPLRIQILELLSEPHTVKQLAKELSIAATKLYYHVNLLDLHGVIRVVGTRIVSGIIEKQYQVSAYRFRVERSLLNLAPSPGDNALEMLLSGMFEQLRSEITTSAQHETIDFSPTAQLHQTLLISRTQGRLPTERAKEFYARLATLVKEFDAVAEDPDNNEPYMYRMAVVMYPITLPQFKEESGDG